MSLSRLLTLSKKGSAGTLTDTERDELENIVREYARNCFEQCPVCGGAFTADLKLQCEIRCPQCETLLETFSSDIGGHDFAEIDASVEPQIGFGVFTVGYTIPGTVPCLLCGVVYPKNYTCCPGLFATALDLYKRGTESQRLATFQFIDSHAETLFNALRGRFEECFGPKVRKLLTQLAPQLKCGLELQNVLAKTAT